MIRHARLVPETAEKKMLQKSEKGLKRKKTILAPRKNRGNGKIIPQSFYSFVDLSLVMSFKS